MQNFLKSWFAKEAKSSRPTITFYNSLTSELDTFEPVSEKEVKIYSCGPTVYDHIHIGNLRAYLLPDLIRRVLEINGHTVKQTINFTDFGHLSDDGDHGEDKMMKALKREGYPITLEAMLEVATPYIESFKKNLTQLDIIEPEHYARASDYIPQQIKLVENLVEAGYTYKASDGIYFSIKGFPDYGKLGNIQLDKLQSAERTAVNSEKKHPADFALWKFAELGWASPWGKGFPGWHTECTAMIFDTLGEQIDIHTGGEDLKYTHHNGEIAEAEAITKKPFVKYWLHNAFITIDDEKFAKSAGNSITLEELSDKGYDPLSYRYWLLTGHYRTPMNFSYKALAGAKEAYQRLLSVVYERLAEHKPTEVPKKYENDFYALANNDLNTAGVIALLWQMLKDASLSDGEKYAGVLLFDNLLGLGLSETKEIGKLKLGFIADNDLPDEIKDLLDQREIARTASNWTEADRLREAIKLKGYEIEDTDNGPKLSQS